MSGPAGRGWRHITSSRDPELTVIEVDGVRLRVHVLLAPIFAWFLGRLVAGGYSLDEVADDWGWADRPIRGTTATTSYHAFGLAIDINATTNPMSSRLITDLPAWADDVAAQVGLSWGGNWRSRKDPMHFEFRGSPADARRIAARLPALAGAAAAARPAPAPPTQEDIMATLQDLERVLDARLAPLRERLERLERPGALHLIFGAGDEQYLLAGGQLIPVLSPEQVHAWTQAGGRPPATLRLPTGHPLARLPRMGLPAVRLLVAPGGAQSLVLDLADGRTRLAVTTPDASAELQAELGLDDTPAAAGDPDLQLPITGSPVDTRSDAQRLAEQLRAAGVAR